MPVVLTRCDVYIGLGFLRDFRSMQDYAEKTGPFDVDKLYKTSCISLTQALITAMSVSQATRGLPSNVQAREYWASVLFSRLCSFASSMHKLMPLSAANLYGTVYDFGSVAALCRSIFEANVAFVYLCNHKLTPTEYDMRLRLVQLHDCTRRPEILRKIGGQPDDDWFNGQAALLREDLIGNIEFRKIDARRQNELLKGRTPYHLSQDDIILEEGCNTVAIRGIYEFLSSHTHSFPFSYWRTPEHGDRGTGKENSVEKGYLAIAAQLGTAILVSSTEEMKKVFSSVTDYPRCIIDWDSITCQAVRGSSFVFGMSNPL